MKTLPILSLLLAGVLALPAAAAEPAPETSQLRCALPALAAYLPTIRAEHRAMAARRAADRVPAPAARELWAWDLTVMPPGFRRVPATVRAQGEHCLIYVEDAEWGRTVDQAAVDKVLATFEKGTPAHPGQGIVDIDRAAFGDIPTGLDGEPRVLVFFTRMGRWHGQGFDGFFNSFDTLPEATAWAEYQQHSNEAEIIYLNTDGNPPSSDYMLSVVSHELVHLLAFPHDAEETSWVGETLGEAGMLLCGYDTDQAHARRYASKPATPLVTEPYVSYGACLMFAAHLVDHQPPGFLKRLAAEPTHGIEGLEKTLASFGPSDGFEGLFANWTASNLASGLGSTSPDFGYRSMSAPAMATTTVPASGLVPAAAQMQATGVRYLRFQSAGDYRLKLESTGPGPLAALLVRAPASAVPMTEPLGRDQLDGSSSIRPAAGDVVAIYGLTPGLHSYRVGIEPASNRRRP